MLLTFVLTVFTWIFFRANDIGHAMSYISEIFSPSLFTMPQLVDELFELAGKEKQHDFKYKKLDTVCNYFFDVFVCI